MAVYDVLTQVSHYPTDMAFNPLKSVSEMFIAYVCVDVKSVSIHFVK